MGRRKTSGVASSEFGFRGVGAHLVVVLVFHRHLLHAREHLLRLVRRHGLPVPVVVGLALLVVLRAILASAVLVVLAVRDLAGRQPARVLLSLLDLLLVVLRPLNEPLRPLRRPRELVRALQVGGARHLLRAVLARRRLLHDALEELLANHGEARHLALEVVSVPVGAVVLLQVVHGGEHHAGRGVARQALVVVLVHPAAARAETLRCVFRSRATRSHRRAVRRIARDVNQYPPKQLHTYTVRTVTTFSVFLTIHVESPGPFSHKPAVTSLAPLAFS